MCQSEATPSNIVKYSELQCSEHNMITRIHRFHTYCNVTYLTSLQPTHGTDCYFHPETVTLEPLLPAEKTTSDTGGDYLGESDVQKRTVN